MIVKNESKIIVRLLDSLEGKIDCISIVDTGSSDHTAELIKDWGKRKGLPTTVFHEPFKNFAYNRTHSYQMAQKTYPTCQYILLSDGDFVWEGELPSKILLTADMYTIDQYDDNLVYSNVRMLRTCINFECRAVTHEFWRACKDQPDFKGEIKQAKITTLRIRDLGDGNCKGDKYERDERLLLAGLADPKEEPDIKTRYKFYLAQTYRDMKKHHESIDMYQRRILDGGWDQEVYFSKYQIGFNYECLGWIEDEKTSTEAKKFFDLAKKAYLDAHEYRPIRAEALYALTKLHRSLGENKEAYDYAIIGQKIKFPKQEVLFLDSGAYDYLFDWEISIVASYVGQMDVGRKCLENLLVREGELPDWLIENCKSNAQFYI